MIYIVNYGLGNIGSIQNMIRKLGGEAAVADTPEQLKDATKIILPGVGAFDTGMTFLREKNWIEVLNEKALVEKVPVLGICLGMHLMTGGSEEGQLPGLGWIKGNVRKFSFDDQLNLKVPHMGWNLVNTNKPSSLITDTATPKRFYFVHSYHVVTDNAEDALLTTDYGYEFTAAFERENILGVQFHPEKSHKFGLELFRNFIELY